MVNPSIFHKRHLILRVVASMLIQLQNIFHDLPLLCDPLKYVLNLLFCCNPHAKNSDQEKERKKRIKRIWDKLGNQGGICCIWDYCQGLSIQWEKHYVYSTLLFHGWWIVGEQVYLIFLFFFFFVNSLGKQMNELWFH